ncbi:MAG TPA: cytochrome c family protein [Novosphingobium sp.]|nr:cytochrome c family protein [Novosphingobium sp.]
MPHPLKGPSLLAGLALAGALALPQQAAAAGDPAAGKVIFAKCAACHSAKAGENRVGPSLFGVVGRKAGSLPDYTYSPAMKASGLTWTTAELDAYLANPRQKLPGIKMIFAGIPAEADRVNLIAYLATLK